jgi:hypothetical protein
LASTHNKREEKEQEKAIDRTIVEETRGNTNRLLNEARKEIPQITAEFHDYQLRTTLKQGGELPPCPFFPLVSCKLHTLNSYYGY